MFYLQIYFWTEKYNVFWLILDTYNYTDTTNYGSNNTKSFCAQIWWEFRVVDNNIYPSTCWKWECILRNFWRGKKEGFLITLISIDAFEYSG